LGKAATGSSSSELDSVVAEVEVEAVVEAVVEDVQAAYCRS